VYCAPSEHQWSPRWATNRGEAAGQESYLNVSWQRGWDLLCTWDPMPTITHAGWPVLRARGSGARSGCLAVLQNPLQRLQPQARNLVSGHRLITFSESGTNRSRMRPASVILRLYLQVGLHGTPGNLAGGRRPGRLESYPGFQMAGGHATGLPQHVESKDSTRSHRRACAESQESMLTPHRGLTAHVPLSGPLENGWRRRRSPWWRLGIGEGFGRCQV
jgi:hypothetical protein